MKILKVEQILEEIEQSLEEMAIETPKTQKTRGRPRSLVKPEKPEKCDLSLQQYNVLGKYKILYYILKS